MMGQLAMSNGQRSTVNRQLAKGIGKEAKGEDQLAMVNEEGVKGGEDGVVGREDKFREAILERTHYGIRVYARVLRQYYQDEVVLLLSGNTCKPAKNPFNGDKKTLHVSIVDGLARHFDAEVEGCRGDAFDFSAMHYKMEGMELLEKLNEELDLGILKNQLAMGNGQLAICNRQLAVCNEQRVTSNGEMGIEDRQVAASDGEIGKCKGEHREEEHTEGNDQNLPQFRQIRQFRQFRQFRQTGKSGETVFSFFKKPVRNTLPSGTISLVDVYKKIKGVGYRRQTNALRAIQNEKEARAYKAEQFDYVTFSGTFTKRENKALVEHSGLFAVDLDHLEDVEGLRQRLLNDPYFETLLLFVSPSGHGLKWIIPIDLNKATHQEYAKAISNYLFHTYRQMMDASGKDVARACFLPCDPNIYINPKYL